MVKAVIDPGDKGDEYEDSINPNYCSSSRWSVAFTPEERLIVARANGIPDLAGSGGGSAISSVVVNRTGPSFFTIILVTVIIGLALVALICIAVQCFFRFVNILCECFKASELHKCLETF